MFEKNRTAAKPYAKNPQRVCRMIYDHTNTYHKLTVVDCDTGLYYPCVESVNTHTSEVALKFAGDPLLVQTLRYESIEMCADAFGTPNKFYCRGLITVTVEKRQP